MRSHFLGPGLPERAAAAGSVQPEPAADAVLHAHNAAAVAPAARAAPATPAAPVTAVASANPTAAAAAPLHPALGAAAGPLAPVAALLHVAVAGCLLRGYEHDRGEAAAEPPEDFALEDQGRR